MNTAACMPTVFNEAKPITLHRAKM